MNTTSIQTLALSFFLLLFCTERADAHFKDLDFDQCSASESGTTDKVFFDLWKKERTHHSASLKADLYQKRKDSITVGPGPHLELLKYAAVPALSGVVTLFNLAWARFGADAPFSIPNACHHLLASTTAGITIRLFDRYQDDTPHLINGLRKIHPLIQEESKEFLKTLPIDLQKRIEDLDDMILGLMGEKAAGNEALQCIRRRQELYLSLPHHALALMDTEAPSSFRIFHILDQQSEAFDLKWYDKSESHAVPLLSDIRANSVTSSPQMIIGSLSLLIEEDKEAWLENVSTTLGLPVCKIDLREMYPEDLLGTSTRDDTCKLRISDVQGKIIECLVLHGVNNPLFYFPVGPESLDASEASTAVRNEFKEFIHPQRTQLKNGGLGISISKSRFTVIIGTNEKD